MDHNVDSGGIVGENNGVVSGCTFEGYIIGPIVGGIVGANNGAITDCHNLSGIVRIGDWAVYSGGIIGNVVPSDNYSNVIITGNTFSTVVTGQQWGIGNDPRQSPPAPSNNGATPIL